MAAVALFTAPPDAAAASWEKPRTTRRYLHPPMADCMFTLWNDGKIMRGMNRHRHDWRIDYADLEADVLWVMHGIGDEPFDFKTSKNRLPPDGIPLHGLSWRIGNLAVDIDAFCQVGVRTPACFARLIVSNAGDTAVKEPFAIFLRRMQERAAVNGAPDLYAPYKTCQEPFRWARLIDPPANEPGVWRSDAATVRVEGLPDGAKWDYGSGAFRFTASLRPGESMAVTFTIAANDSPVRPCDWDSSLVATEAFWRGELARIDRLPPTIRDNPEKLRLVKNLVVQMLQCFCHPEGSDLTLPRQGGLQRYVWPWDCKYMLEALGRIGDFSSYVEGALNLYFREYATPEGRIGPFRNNWACSTGDCLTSLARYCLDAAHGAAVWARHREAALGAFEWIRRTCAQSADGAHGVPGLFPVSWATDNKTPIQLWVLTDMGNLVALNALAEAARKFDDPCAGEIRAEADRLRSALAEVYARFSKAAEGRDEMRIPLTPDGDDETFLKAGYFDIFQGFALDVGFRCGYVPAEDVQKVYTWHLRNGKAHPSGLCAAHPPRDDLSNPHYWYTTASELYWHDLFLRMGRRDLADRVMGAVLRYSITDEFYVGERYRDDNPWYLPWSPNASGSGRIVLMMLNGATRVR